MKPFYRVSAKGNAHVWTILFILTSVQLSFGQLFQQDFNSSLSVASYVSGAPNNQQFNSILVNAGVTVGISGSLGAGALTFTKTATSTGTFSRSTDLPATPQTMKFSFDLTVTNSSSSINVAQFKVGSGFSALNVPEANASTYGRFAIDFGGTNNFLIRDVLGVASPLSFTGTKRVTWVLNNSNHSILYTDPNSSLEPLGVDKMDIWVGGTKVYNDIVVQTAALPMTDLKFAFTGATSGSITLDNILVDYAVPEVVCPIPTVINANAGATVCGANLTLTPPVINGTACSPVNVVNSFNGTGNASGFYPVATTIVNWTITDACGNSVIDNTGNVANCSQTVTVTDVTPPVITHCPSSPAARGTSTGFCSYNAAGGEFDITAVDNCAGTSITLKINGTPSALTTLNGYAFPTGSTHIQWTASDGAHAATCDFDVVVTDAEHPSFSFCPSNASPSADINGCGYTSVGNEFNPVASDNCGVTSLTYVLGGATPGSGSLIPSGTGLTGVLFNPGLTTVTWTARDLQGNTNVCQFNVTVSDLVKPVIHCPGDISLDCNAVDLSHAGTATATDNCDPSPVVTYQDATIPGSCAGSYTISRTWTARDASGNEKSCVQTITVTDTHGPVFSGVPANTSADCSTVPTPPTVTAADDCSGVNPAGVQFSETRTSGNCAGNYTLHRTWTATDNCGNQSTAMQSITVTDVTPPLLTGTILSGSSNVNACSAPSGPTEADIAAQYTDGCGSAITVTKSGTPTGGPCGWSVTYTYHIEDQCGNAVNPDVTISYDGHDQNAPGLTGTIPSGGTNMNACSAPAGPSEADIASQYTDDCGGLITVTKSGTPTGGTCGWSVTYTYHITDQCGNAVNPDVTISYDGHDQNAPGLTGTIPSGNTNMNACSAPAGPSEADIASQYTDDCGGLITVTKTGTPTGGPCGWSVTYTYHITDQCGNAVNPDVTISYDGHDQNAPGLTGTIPSGNTNMNACSAPAGPSEADIASQYTDDCGGLITVTKSGTPTGGPCGWSVTYTYHITDQCGNAVNPDVTISYDGHDQNAPGLTGTIPSGNTNMNACSAPAGPSEADIASQYTDDCGGLITVTKSGTPTGGPCGWSVTYTYHITDQCGNAVNPDVTISYDGHDQNRPTWLSAPGDLDRIVECDDVVGLADAQSLFPDGTDDCTPALQLHYDKTAGNFIAGSCTHTGTITNTFVASDACGNPSESYTQVITILDTHAPVLTGTIPSGNTNMNACSAPAGPSEADIAAQYTDACGGPITVTKSGTPTGGPCGWSVTYTYHIEDQCGNAVNPDVTISYDGHDQNAPGLTGTIPSGNTNMNACSAPAGPSEADIASQYTDDCGGLITVTKSGTPTGGPCNWSVTYTYHITDQCGNAVNPDVTISYDGHDQNAPGLTGTIPSGGTNMNACSAPAGPSEADIAAQYTDDCGGLITVTKTGTPTGGPCNWSVTYTYHITDQCGNAVNPDVTISYDGHDQNAPGLTGTIPSGGTNMNACSAPAGPSEADIAAQYTDDCGGLITVTKTGTPTGGPCNWSVTYTYHITDQCGNAVNPDVTISYDGHDQNAPGLTGTIPSGGSNINACSAPAGPSEADIASQYTDDCGGLITVTKSGTPTGGTCGWSVTYTYHITDQCGNAVNPDVTISYDGHDQNAPGLTGTIPSGGTNMNACSAPAGPSEADIASQYTDDCGGLITVTKSGTPTGGPCGWSVTYTYHITDQCGNAVNPDVTISYDGHDQNAPGLTGTIPSGNTNMNACSAPAGPSEADIASQYTDDCGGLITVTKSGTPTGGPCGWSVTYTYHITDQCGNAVNPDVTISYDGHDQNAPGLTGTIPSGNTNMNACSAPAGPSEADIASQYTDDCGGLITVTKSGTPTGGPCGWSVTYTYHITDQCGNAVNPDVTISYDGHDQNRPTWLSAPGDLDRIVECDDVVGLADAQSLFPDGTDDCTPALQLHYDKTAGNFIAGSCTHTGTITNTFVASDACGNPSESYTQVITILDTHAPVLTGTIPSGNTNMNACSAPAGPSEADIAAQYTDACGGPITVTKSGTPTGGPCGWSVTYTYHIEDQCGNAVNPDVTISYDGHDQNAPGLTGTIPSGNTNMNACSAPAGPSEADIASQYTDDCGGLITVTKSGTPTGGPCNWSVTYTYHITDQCGNAVNPDVTISYDGHDQNAPGLTGTIPSGGTNMNACSAPAGPSEADIAAQYTDDCGGLITVTKTGTPTGGPCNWSVTYTYHITDQCGNAVNPDVTISYDGHDQNAPGLTGTIPSGGTNMNACSAPAGPSEADIAAQYTDDCGGLITVTKTGTPTGGPCNWSVTYTYHITDQCGNAVNPDVTISYDGHDQNAPGLTGTIPSGGSNINACSAPAGPSEADIASQYTDDCGGLITVTKSGTPTGGTCGWSVTYTYHITDQCGNAVNPDVTISYDGHDQNAPGLTGTIPSGGTNMNACSAPAGPSEADIASQYTDDCGGLITVTKSGTPTGGPCGWSVTYTYHITDQCGNAVNPDVTISYDGHDQNAPGLTGTIPSGNTNMNACSAPAGPSEADIASQYTDDCGGLITVTKSGTPTGGTCGWSVTYTYHITDQCGNAVNPDVTISYDGHDQNAPGLTGTIPSGGTNMNACSAPAGPSEADIASQYTDDCGGLITVTKSGTPTGGPCNWSVTYTYHITDQCGNAVNPDVTISYDGHDQNGPTWLSAPGDLDRIVECDDVVGLADAQSLFPDGTDDCTPALQLHYDKTAGNFIAGSCTHTGTITNTFVASDACGNPSESYTQVITILDTHAPVLTGTIPSGGSNINACSAPAGPSEADIASQYTDDCGGLITVTKTGTPTGGPCNWSVTYTYHITDQCGNAVNPDVTISYDGHDQNAPGLTGTIPSGGTNMNACSAPAGPSEADIAAQYTDDCGGLITVTKTGTPTGGPCGWSVTYTYHITDQCGNAVNPDVTISYDGHDQNAPGLTGTIPSGGTNMNACSAPAGPSEADIASQYTDDCGGLITVTKTGTPTGGPCNWSVTYTYHITDQCGNAVNPDVTISYDGHDQNAPGLTGTIPSGNTNMNACSAPAGPSEADIASQYTDDCGGLITVTKTGTPTGGPCGWSVTYTYHIEDQCGNAVNPDVTISYDGHDQNAPGLTGTIPSGGTNMNACSAPAGPSEADIASQYTDDCGGLITVTKSGTPTGGTCGWSVTYTYHITDQCGNAVNPDVTISYDGHDQNAPGLTGTIPSGNTNMNACSAPAGPSEADIASQYTDDCGGLITVTKSGTPTGGPCNWSVTYTYHITDQCGNAVNPDVTISYDGHDQNAPGLTGTIPSGGTNMNACSAPAGPSEADIASQYTDDCGGLITVTKSGTPTGGTCGWSVTYTYHITDQCGNAVNPDVTISYDGHDQNAPGLTGTIPSGGTNMNACSAPAGPSEADIASQYTDDCGGLITVTKSGTPTGGPCGWSVTYTYHITDQCGNAVNPDVTISYDGHDQNGPTWLSVPGDLDRTVECDDVTRMTEAQALFPDATDDCTPALQLHYNKLTGNFVAGSCTHTGTITNTFVASDACGNPSESYTQVITILDTHAPALTGTIPSGNTNMNACSAPAGPSEADIAAQYTDACGGPITVTKSGTPTGGPCGWSVTYTYHIEDQCGNAVNPDVTISYDGHDQNAPGLTGTIPSGNTNMNACSAPAGPSEADIASQYTDDCGGLITVTKSGTPTGGPCNWSVTYTYHITDQCGNAVNPDVTISYDGHDQNAPGLTGTIPSGNTNMNACSAPAGPSEADIAAQYTDDCGGLITVTKTGTPTGGPCNWSVTYTYHITDQCGNAVNPDVTISYDGHDQNAPGLTGTIPSGGTNMNACSAPAGPSEADIAAQYTDDCGGLITVTKSGTPTGGPCGWSVTYTYHITDQCGNAVNPDVTISYDGHDQNAPGLTGTIPSGGTNMNACSAPAGPSEADIAVQYTDDCGGLITVTKSGIPTGGTCGWSVTYTYHITDQCGNAVNPDVTISYDGHDQNAPGLTGTIPSGGTNMNACSAPAGPSEADIAAQYTDDCSGLITVTKSGTPTGGPCGWNVTYTYHIEDQCGNAVNPDVTISYDGHDQNAPGLTGTIPSGGTNMNACSAPAGPSEADIASQYTDDCGGLITVTKSGTPTGGTCGWSVTYTYHITDQCGNAVNPDVTISYDGHDQNAPGLTGTIPSGGTNMNACSAPAGPSEADIASQYTDDCGGLITVTKTGTPLVGACNWSVTYTYHIEDQCGNAVNPDVTISYDGHDQNGPTWLSAPGDLNRIVECDDVVGLADAQALFPDATDDCTPALQLHYDKTPGNFVAGSCPQSGTITNLFIARDVCGNPSNSYTQVITIQDTHAPTWSTPANNLDRTVECSNAGALAAAQLLEPVAHDNCASDASLSLHKVSGPFVANLIDPHTGTYTNTWTVTDPCSNTSLVFTQVITVVDHTNPDITCPGNKTIYVDATCTVLLPDYTSEAVVSDNCSTPVVTQSPLPGTPETTGIVQVTLTATDASGNHSNCQFNVSVKDNTPPDFHNCPGNFVATRSCAGPVSWIEPTATDNCPGAVHLVSNYKPGDNFPIGVTTVTYTATDISGNSSTCSFTVTINQLAVSVSSPNFPGGYNVSCNGSTNGSANAIVTNNQGGVTYSWSPGGATTSGITGLAGGSTYTVTVTNGTCTASASRTITQPPVLSVSALATNVSCYSAHDGSALATPVGGNSGYTYLWNNSQTTNPATGLAPGSYSVRVTDINGCSATSNVVTVTQPAIMNANTSKTDVSCNGGSNGTANAAASGGSSPYSYSWNTVPVKTTASVTGLSANIYIVTITDAHGCSLTRSVTINQPLSPLSVSIQTTSTPHQLNAVASGGTLPLTSYLWSPGGATTQMIISTSTSQLYTVNVIDSKGCRASASRNGVRLADPATAIGQMDPKVYPNPTMGEVTVEFNASQNDKYRIAVRDFLGQTVFMQEGVAGDGVNKFDYNLEDLAEGIYLLSIEKGDESAVLRLIIK